MVDTFAQLSTGELTALLGVLVGGFGTLLGGFYVFTRNIMKDARDERTTERKEFTTTLKDLADSNREIAEATKRGNAEAEKRNGHLAELTIESSKQMLEAISHIKNQQVVEQTVEHQHIENKE